LDSIFVIHQSFKFLSVDSGIFGKKLLKDFFVVGFFEHLFDCLPVDVVVLIDDGVQEVLIVMFLNPKGLFHKIRIKPVLLGDFL
jgi:hypothetical protein